VLVRQHRRRRAPGGPVALHGRREIEHALELGVIKIEDREKVLGAQGRRGRTIDA